LDLPKPNRKVFPSRRKHHILQNKIYLGKSSETFHIPLAVGNKKKEAALRMTGNSKESDSNHCIEADKYRRFLHTINALSKVTRLNKKQAFTWGGICGSCGRCTLKE